MREMRDQLEHLRHGIQTYQNNIQHLSKETKHLAQFYSDLQKEHQNTFLQCEAKAFKTPKMVSWEDTSSVTKSVGLNGFSKYRGHSSLDAKPSVGRKTTIRSISGGRERAADVPVWIEEKYKRIQKQYQVNPRERSDYYGGIGVSGGLAAKANHHDVWQRSVKRSGMLFSPDSTRMAILESISMAWTKDKYRHVDTDTRR